MYKFVLASIICFLAFTTVAGVGKAAEHDIFQAIAAGDVEVVRKLAAADPDAVAAKDDKGLTTVLAALFRTHDGSFFPPNENAVLEEILKQEPELSFFEAIGIGETAAVRRFLENDPTLALSRHPVGWGPVHFAAFSGSTPTIQLLLDAGSPADVRADNHILNTPLQVALLVGQLDAVRLLVDKGADVLTRQEQGFAPLHIAALHGRKDVVDLLLERGADIRSRANDGRTAVTEALRGGHPELAVYLRSRGGQDAAITADMMVESKP